MSNDLRDQYLEAVRLYLWYQGSDFSWHTGKTSKELASRYKNLAHNLFEEYVKNASRT